MSDFDYQELLRDISAALSGELMDSYASVKALIEKQAKGVATMASLLTRSRIDGQAREDEEVFEVMQNMLRDAVVNLAKVVVAMTILTIEKAWNAIVGVVWSAINTSLTAAGLGAIDVPGVPEI